LKPFGLDSLPSLTMDDSISTALSLADALITSPDSSPDEILRRDSLQEQQRLSLQLEQQELTPNIDLASQKEPKTPQSGPSPLGAPGHTPYPGATSGVQRGTRAEELLFQVPYNSPIERVDWERLLIEEQERILRQEEEEDKAQMSDLHTPERSVSRPRKRLNLDDICSPPSCPTAAAYDPVLFQRLEELVASRKVNDILTPRRQRELEAVDTLRQVVPGLEPMQDKSKVLDASARYLLFLKRNVGSQFDEEFLRKEMSF